MTIPAGEAAAGPGAGENLNVGLDASKTSERKEEESSEILEERIFAVCYRKVKFDWPFKKDVSTAKLSAKNVCVSISSKRGDAEDDERCIEADLESDDEPLSKAAESVKVEMDGEIDEFYLYDRALQP